MRTIKLGLLAAFLLSPAAYALDLGHGLSLKGFGTLGMVSSTNNQADFLAGYYSQSAGAGQTEDTSLRVDSKVGLQLDYGLSDRWHFTAQTVSKQRENGNWAPELEWAFAKYNLLPNLAVRSGRLRLPLYMMSDTLDVNFANPWIRPPVEVYGSNPISRMNIDGIDVLWRPVTGSVTWLIQPFYGSTKFNVKLGSHVKADDVFGAQVAGSVGDFTLRGAFFRTHAFISDPDISGQLLPALSQLCGFADAVACQQSAVFQQNGKPINFGALGAAWDNGDYFVNAEYAMRDTQIPTVSDNSSWYLTLGKRWKQLTPFISYARAVNNSPTQFIEGSGMLGQMTNAIVTQAMQANPMDQATITLGLRYDMLSNLALKFQWDRIDTFTKDGLAGTGRGVFFPKTTAFSSSDNSVDLFSLSMDFVF